MEPSFFLNKIITLSDIQTFKARIYMYLYLTIYRNGQIDKTPLIYFCFCFIGATLYWKFLKWSWAIVVQIFWSSSSFFFIVLLLFYCFFTHFQSSPHTWSFSEEYAFCLLCQLIRTYESFKHKKATNSRDKSIFCLHIAKN